MNRKLLLESCTHLLTSFISSCNVRLIARWVRWSAEAQSNTGTENKGCKTAHCAGQFSACLYQRSGSKGLPRGFYQKLTALQGFPHFKSRENNRVTWPNMTAWECSKFWILRSVCFFFFYIFQFAVVISTENKSRICSLLMLKPNPAVLCHLTSILSSTLCHWLCQYSVFGTEHSPVLPSSLIQTSKLSDMKLYSLQSL